MKKFKLLITMLTLAPIFAFAQSDLESRIDELEENQLLNIFSFSGNLKYMYDSRQLETDAGDKQDGNWNRLSMGFNVVAKPYEDITFYSTFRMSKFFNTIFGNEPNEGGLTESRSFTGSQLYVEKAYADVKMSDSLVFSFGRLPTIEGVPTNYHDGKSLMGTYPLMAYSATLDGLALTYKPLNSLALRMVYTPFQGAPTNFSAEDDANNDGDSDGKRVAFDTEPVNVEVITAMLDYTTSFSWARSFNVVLQYTDIPKYDLYHAATGTASGGTVATVPNSGVHFETTLTTIHVEMLDLANIGLNLSVSHLMTENLTEATGALATSDSSGTQKGSGTLLALQYAGLQNHIFGLHYLSSTKEYGKFDSINNTLGSIVRDSGMESFMSTIGSAADVYYTHRFKPTFTGTLGYMMQDIDAVNWGRYGITNPSETDSSKKKINTAYMRLNLDF